MTTAYAARFGDLLRSRRRAARLSQLDLAVAAGVSQRHISFLETGRSLPSREMVVHLAVALDVPLRERNVWLTAAGYAPLYPERSLDEPSMGHLRHVLERLLDAHRPFPAYVVDRRWNIVLANTAAGRLTALLVDPAGADFAQGNIARLTLHPEGLRPHIANWRQVASVLVQRLEREAAHRPGDDEMAALLDEVRSYPEVADLDQPELPTAVLLAVPLHLRHPEFELELLTTITTFGAAWDVTLEELRLETLLPADPASEDTLRRLDPG